MWPNAGGAQQALLFVLIQTSLNFGAAAAKSSKVSGLKTCLVTNGFIQPV